MSQKMKINAERVNYIWKEEVMAVLFDLLPDVPFVNEYDNSYTKLSYKDNTDMTHKDR